MILNIIGTLFVVISMLCIEGFKLADPNFRPPLYQSLIYHGWAILTIIGLWK